MRAALPPGKISSYELGALMDEETKQNNDAIRMMHLIIFTKMAIKTQ
jgi:hypothetical protein